MTYWDVVLLGRWIHHLSKFPNVVKSDRWYRIFRDHVFVSYIQHVILQSYRRSGDMGDGCSISMYRLCDLEHFRLESVQIRTCIFLHRGINSCPKADFISFALVERIVSYVDLSFQIQQSWYSSKRFDVGVQKNVEKMWRKGGEWKPYWCSQWEAQVKVCEGAMFSQTVSKLCPKSRRLWSPWF